MKYALALSALLIASPAMAEGSLRTAALTAVGIEVCGAQVPKGLLTALVERGSQETGIPAETAAYIALGMKLAYTDIIARTGTAAEFCSSTKTARVGQ
jgi:hypothetical protein